MTRRVEITYRNRLYVVPCDMRLVCEVERELGGLVPLRLKFAQDAWAVGDLVALIQLMLGHVGVTADFMRLGDDMLRFGLARYLSAAQRFLGIV